MEQQPLTTTILKSWTRHLIRPYTIWPKNQKIILGLGYSNICAGISVQILRIIKVHLFFTDYNPDHLSERSMEEVYYLWQLAGGDLDGVLKKAGLIKVRPPVTILPRFVPVFAYHSYSKRNLRVGVGVMEGIVISK